MKAYRIRPEAAVYFLTYSVVDWLPVLIGEKTCRIVTDSLSFCHREKHLRINAYVIMPTHMHLIVFDADFDSERLLSWCRRLACATTQAGRLHHDAAAL